MEEEDVNLPLPPAVNRVHEFVYHVKPPPWKRK